MSIEDVNLCQRVHWISTLFPAQRRKASVLTFQHLHPEFLDRLFSEDRGTQVFGTKWDNSI